MAFWNLSHNLLHMHVWLLPAIAMGIIMIVAGLIHADSQRKREEKFEEQLRGESPEAAAAEKEATV